MIIETTMHEDNKSESYLLTEDMTILKEIIRKAEENKVPTHIYIEKGLKEARKYRIKTKKKLEEFDEHEWNTYKTIKYAGMQLAINEYEHIE